MKLLPSVRLDQRVRFVLIRDPRVTVTWMYGEADPLYDWHATADKRRSVCGTRRVSDIGAPAVSDRSNDPKTCSICADLVRRVKPEKVEGYRAKWR